MLSVFFCTHLGQSITSTSVRHEHQKMSATLRSQCVVDRYTNKQMEKGNLTQLSWFSSNLECVKSQGPCLLSSISVAPARWKAGWH